MFSSGSIAARVYNTVVTLPSTTEHVSVWRAWLAGDCKQIHLSELELWRELKNDNCWYMPVERNRWTVTSSIEEVPVVNGEAHDWTAEGGAGGIHIHWSCPYCLETHHTDQWDSVSPALWSCENGEGIALVRWKPIVSRA